MAPQNDKKELTRMTRSWLAPRNDRKKQLTLLMKNKKLFNAIVKISLLSTILAMSFQVFPVNAASTTPTSDTMSRLKAATVSNHDIRFKTPTGVDALTDTITITFPAGFDLATNSVAFGDMDLNVDAACDGVYEISKTLAAAPGASPIWGAVVGGQVVTLTAPTDAAAGEIAATACVQVLIGTNATGGVNQIINPAAGNDKVIAIAGTFGDTGSLAVSIVADDRVVITASIDATFTFVISSNTCALGTLTTGAVATCNYTLAVGTNATSGAVITIQAIDTGDGQTKLHGVATPANNVNDIGEAVVSIGVEGYGIRVATGGTWAASGNFTTDDSSVPSALTTILSVGTPIAVATTNTITHRAAIDATTQAGAYIQTVQYIATGTF
jgi:hypothetical protein